MNKSYITGGGKYHDYSIDIIKCFAAILITWSHMREPLGDYSVLATGGSLGDALFFFASGYTLFIGSRGKGFFNWYKNRINRIYPTVLAWALVLCIFFGSGKNLLEVIKTGGGWFVSYIMVFYTIFYPIKKMVSNHLGVVLTVSLMLSACSYLFVNHDMDNQENAWLYSSFFSVMLLGGIIGKKMKEGFAIPFKSSSVMIKIFGIIFCICGFFGLSYLEESYSRLAWLRSINIFAIGGFAYFAYILCNTSLAERCYNSNIGSAIILTIGGLCLEIYLVQAKLMTDKLNDIFPFNIVLIFIAIVISAYILRCLSRLLGQTFKDADYNWKEIIKLY